MTTSRDEPDVTLLYLVKQVELAIRQRLDEIVGSQGLTSLQYTALTVLDLQPGITAAALARNSFVRAQTMAQMITFLEGRGFVRRESDATNRKQVRLFLSDEGESVVTSLRDPVAALEGSMVQGLTDAARSRLRSALLECRVGLEAHRES